MQNEPLTIHIYDAKTGEETIREMTKEEKQAYEAFNANSEPFVLPDSE